MILEKNNLILEKNNLQTSLPIVNQILHRVDSLICTPENWQSSSTSYLKAIMALDHRRLIRPGKKNQAGLFAFDKLTLQNVAKKSGCVRVNQPFIPVHLYITSEVKQYYEALFLSYRPRTECSISQFCNTNCTHLISRTIEECVAMGF